LGIEWRGKIERTAVNRIATVGVLAAAALVGAEVASAKGPSHAKVCGKSLDRPTARACSVLTESNEIFYDLLDQSEPFTLVETRPRPAPFYRVGFAYHHSPAPGEYRWSSYIYVPSRRLMRITMSGGAGPYWRAAPATVMKAFETVSKQLRPFPAPRRWR
jgi:hypothetical protein